MAQDFSDIVAHFCAAHALRVKRWRPGMSGCAWRVLHRDGRIENWIESPYPKTPISLSIFLHEVGHHVIGFNTYRIRCEEELRAWQWSIKAMHAIGVEPDARVLRRFEMSMKYAVAKAIRRGIKRLPIDLVEYLPANVSVAA